jgi:hypothetical protein
MSMTKRVTRFVQSIWKRLFSVTRIPTISKEKYEEDLNEYRDLLIKAYRRIKKLEKRNKESRKLIAKLYDELH